MMRANGVLVWGIDSDYADSDGDDNFLDDIKDDKPTRAAYEVDFSTLSDAQLRAAQKDQIEELRNVLGLSSEQTAILLRFFKWQKEKLLDKWMDSQESVLDEAGLGEGTAIEPKLEVVKGFCCDICCDDEDGLKTYAMRKCGHRFCAGCYQQYLESKVKTEGEAARIQCPEDGCKKIVDSKTVQLLVGKDVWERYESSPSNLLPKMITNCFLSWWFSYNELLVRTYVDDKPNLRWCPAPNCEYAVDCKVRQTELHKIIPTVTCQCNLRFCFGCGLPDHQPCPCALVKKWLKKCEDDSETANWISAHTKECPKCVSTIEKNGGCNHMTW